MRVASRRKRNHFLRVFYLAALLLLLMAFWASSAPGRYDYGVAYRMQLQAELGQGFFATFAIFCVCCMGLIAPILTSTAINSERLGNTLSTLLMTPISSWQIVAGKLFSRLLIVLTLIGLSLPVLAVARLLGGVELWQMLTVIAICINFAIFCAAMGLFYSAIINRAYAVILLCYVTHFLIYFLFPLLTVLVIESRYRTAPPGWWFYSFFAAINPVMNVALIAMPDSPIGRAGITDYWLPGILLHLTGTILLLVATSFIVRRHDRHKGPRAAQITTATPLIAPEAVAEGSAPSPSTHASPIRSANSADVGNNPVLWRELRRPLFSKRFAYPGAFVCVLLLVGTYGAFAMTSNFRNVLAEPELQIGFMSVFHGLFWLLVAVLSATAIAQEKESDTWTLLLTAPLKAKQIVMGKFLGICRRLFWPLMLVVAHLSIFTICGVISIFQMILGIWIMITFNAVWAATGLYLSLKMRKVTSAVVINLLLPVVLYAVIPTMAAITSEMSRNDNVVEATGLYIPYVYQIVTFNPRSYSYNGYANQTPPFFESQFNMPLLNDVSAIYFVSLTTMLCVLHLLIAWLILQWTIRRFDSLVGRATATDGASLPAYQTFPAPPPPNPA